MSDINLYNDDCLKVMQQRIDKMYEIIEENKQLAEKNEQERKLKIKKRKKKCRIIINRMIHIIPIEYKEYVNLIDENLIDDNAFYLIIEENK